MPTEKEKHRVEQELIEVIIRIDGYRGDIARSYDEITHYERLMAEAESEKNRLIGDWYDAA